MEVHGLALGGHGRRAVEAPSGGGSGVRGGCDSALEEARGSAQCPCGGRGAPGEGVERRTSTPRRRRTCPGSTSPCPCSRCSTTPPRRRARACRSPCSGTCWRKRRGGEREGLVVCQSGSGAPREEGEGEGREPKLTSASTTCPPSPSCRRATARTRPASCSSAGEKEGEENGTGGAPGVSCSAPRAESRPSGGAPCSTR